MGVRPLRAHVLPHVAAALIAWAGGGALLAAGCDGGGGGAAASSEPPRWMAQVGGDGYQSPTSIAVSSGGSAVGAVYSGQLTVDGFPQGGMGVGLEGAVIGYDASRAPRWVQRLEGPADDAVVGVAVDGAGEVLVAAQATAGATFAGRAIAADGYSTALVARLRSTGEPAWITVARGGGVQAANAVAPLADGGAFFAGDFTADLDFGLGPVTATDGGDGFVGRLDASGRVTWLVPITGSGIQHVARLAVTPDGGVAVIGSYQGQLEIAARTFTPDASEVLVPFVAKVGADGAAQWAQTELIPTIFLHAHSDHPGHGGLVIQDLALAALASGDVVSAVSYGTPFSGQGQDFEAPSVGNITLTRILAGDGAATDQANLQAAPSLVQLGAALAVAGNRLRLAASWTGDITVGGQTLHSANHRSVLLLDVDASWQFDLRATFSVPDVGLTVQDAALADDGSVVVAAGWNDLDRMDQDILVAGFR